MSLHARAWLARHVRRPTHPMYPIPPHGMACTPWHGMHPMYPPHVPRPTPPPLHLSGLWAIPPQPLLQNCKFLEVASTNSSYRFVHRWRECEAQSQHAAPPPLATWLNAHGALAHRVSSSRCTKALHHRAGRVCPANPQYSSAGRAGLIEWGCSAMFAGVVGLGPAVLTDAGCILTVFFVYA